jgi:broad specificity phosphatase PhoE
MLRLYITRHGETEWNLERRMQGQKDSRLSAKGIKDAAALGERLKNVDFNCICASSSGRAVHTAELVRGNRNIPLVLEDSLREINLGDWEGKTDVEVRQLDPQEHKAFWETPHLYVPKSGESFLQVRDRIEVALKNIIDENQDGNVLIVTHAVIVKTIMSIFKALSVEKVWDPPFVKGTSLCIVEIDGKKTTVVRECDESHL